MQWDHFYKCRLQERAIHVWLVHLDALSAHVAELKNILSNIENKKAHRFYFEQDFRRYAASRAVLRLLLGSYLDQLPVHIQFVENDYGKPFLSPRKDDDIKFNVSHSGGYALIAIGRVDELGVDIEEHRQEFATLEIARRFFAAAEISKLQTCLQERFDEWFFNCWTRKEAYIKAKGLGLSLPLDSFAVEIEGKRSPKLLMSTRYPGDVENYFFSAFTPVKGYSAALAVKDAPVVIKFLKFQLNLFYK